MPNAKCLMPSLLCRQVKQPDHIHARSNRNNSNGSRVLGPITAKSTALNKSNVHKTASNIQLSYQAAKLSAHRKTIMTMPPRARYVQSTKVGTAYRGVA